MGIGTKLNRLMKERGTNANELASRVNISPQTIYSMINRDSRKADIDVLIRIARELGVTAEYFCNEEEPEQPVTIAAHFDGQEYTPEELDEIRQFAEFVKRRRKNE